MPRKKDSAIWDRTASCAWEQKGNKVTFSSAKSRRNPNRNWRRKSDCCAQSWRKSRRREGHVAYGSIRHLWNRDGCEGFLTPRSFAREIDADGDETSAQNDHRRSSQEEGRVDGTVNRFAFQYFIGRKNSARCGERANRRDHHSGESQNYQDAAAQAGERLRSH